MAKLSKVALGEVANQLCIICHQAYSEQLESINLPCGHYYCVECVSREVEKLTGQPVMSSADDRDKEDGAKGGFAEPLLYDSKNVKPNDPRFTPKTPNPTLECPICSS